VELPDVLLQTVEVLQGERDGGIGVDEPGSVREAPGDWYRTRRGTGRGPGDGGASSCKPLLEDLRRVRPRTAKPLIVKLTPNASEPQAVAAAAQAAGADAVSLINTLKGMALHPRTKTPWLGGGSGGVSGPAVRAIALEQVYTVARAVVIPVIGMGGIQTGRHAADFLAAGAAAVAVGTESFRDPAAGARIADDLAVILASERGLSESEGAPAGTRAQG